MLTQEEFFLNIETVPATVTLLEMQQSPPGKLA